MRQKDREPVLILPILSWTIYVVVYFGRMNLSITIPYLQNELGHSKVTFGLLASGYFCTYALGQFINGVLGDRIQARYFVSLGLLMAGICNIVFGLFRTFPVIFFAWSINGFFQSMLWGPLLRAISESIPHNKLDNAKFLMSTSPPIGHLVSYVLIGQLALLLRWEAAFFVPGVILIMMSGIWYFGLPRIMRKTNMEENRGTQNAALASTQPGGRRIIDFIIHSKIHLMGLIAICAGIIREGLTLWGPVLFIEPYSLKMEKMLSVMSFLPIEIGRASCRERVSLCV
jgi:OPA family glycerol-3-phosphate transporter-like MFS transporter